MRKFLPWLFTVTFLVSGIVFFTSLFLVFFSLNGVLLLFHGVSFTGFFDHTIDSGGGITVEFSLKHEFR